MLKSISITEFREALGLGEKEGVDILLNKNTGKLFALAGTETFRVHQFGDITPEERQAKVKATSKWVVLVEDGDLTEACIIPAGLGAPVLKSLY